MDENEKIFFKRKCLLEVYLISSYFGFFSFFFNGSKFLSSHLLSTSSMSNTPSILGVFLFMNFPARS